jgi:calcineurin-like phosphoesterase family protein
MLKYAQRPYQSVDQMNAALIANYNSVVGEEDCVLWLGDCFFVSFHESKTILDSLNGTKALLLGNHDRSVNRMTEMGFSFVSEIAHINIAGVPVKVCHYPYKSGACDDRKLNYPMKQFKKEILIHGHTHSARRVQGRSIHVGCDAWNWSPAPVRAITKLINNL